MRACRPQLGASLSAIPEVEQGPLLRGDLYLATNFTDIDNGWHMRIDHIPVVPKAFDEYLADFAVILPYTSPNPLFGLHSFSQPIPVFRGVKIFTSWSEPLPSFEDFSKVKEWVRLKTTSPTTEECLIARLAKRHYSRRRAEPKGEPWMRTLYFGGPGA